VPPLRMDCVVGPEEVIREAAREYLDHDEDAEAPAADD
jgi:hypothetical protein